MTDTSSLLPNHVGITSDCLYNLKPSAVRSRSYRASVLPTNGGTRNPGDTTILYIPGGRRASYLDCQQTYLKYTVNNTDSSGNINFDGCGASVINRIDVFHGSNLLETIQGYNNLACYITDFNMTGSQKVGLSASYGFDAGGLRAGATIAKSSGQTICMPVFSGVIGLGNSKMLPVGMLCDDIRVEITWEQNSLGMAFVDTTYATSAGASPWSVSGIELELCIVELSDEGEQMVRSESPPDKPIYIASNSWRHYTASYTASAGMSSFIVPARFASLKSIVCLPHRNVDAIVASYAIASRVNPNIAYYYWRIGSALVPSKPVYLENGTSAPFNCAGGAEAFMEIQRSWHSLNTAANASSVIATYYNVRDVALTGTPWTVAGVSTTNAKGDCIFGFAIAQEMETFSNRSDVLFSGLNTLTQQVFFEFNVNTAATTATAWTLDFFANYDQVMIMENGLLSVRF